MEITSVKVVEPLREKSLQEIEKDLIVQKELQDKQREEAAKAAELEKTELEKTVIDPPIIELDDERVLSYIEKTYNKRPASITELLAERQQQEELPEDVNAYFKYKKETGRGIEDFVRLNRDLDSIDTDTLLAEHYLATEEGAVPEDVADYLEAFKFDEELDEEIMIKKAKAEKRKAVSKAKKFFSEQKEKYKVPLESRPAPISTRDAEELEQYRQYIKTATTQQEEAKRKSEWFSKKTDELFSSEFKGFEFEIAERKLVFNPGDAAELKNNQSTPFNFINRYMDEAGMIKDPVGYHKALAVAMNPEKFAKFFYEQGIADNTEAVMKKMKNIDMSERTIPELAGKGGFQVRAVNPTDTNQFKVKGPPKK